MINIILSTNNVLINNVEFLQKNILLLESHNLMHVLKDPKL